MKVALALFACFAVSQAAFTGTLQQRVQPSVDQAFFKMQLATGRSALSDYLANLLKPHVQGLLNGMQGHLETAQNVWANIQAEVTQVAQALHADAADVLASLNNVLGGQLSGLFGNGKMDVASIVAAAQTHFTNMMTQAQNTVDFLMTQAHAMASQLTLENLLSWAASQLGLQRGFFSGIWGSLTEAAGNAWDTVSGHASSAYDQAIEAWNQMTGIVSNAASATWAGASSMADAFLDDAQDNLASMSAQAALQFQDMMSNWSDQLGGKWEQIQQEVAAIVAADNKPTGRRF